MNWISSLFSDRSKDICFQNFPFGFDIQNLNFSDLLLFNEYFFYFIIF